MQKRILIVSGEASGDHHGAKLVEAVRQIEPNVQFFGMGGEHMRRAGVEIIIDAKAMAVVGAIEILSHFVPIVRAWHKLRTIIKREPPDLVVLIDYPEFNLQIAKAAKKAGVKVLYYISPQVWAWKQHRVKTIRQRIDKMLVILPFEEAFYRERGVTVEFVGHPLSGTVRPSLSPDAARAAFGIDAGQRVIGLAPGSRKGEIRRLLPVILAAAERLKQQHPELAFVLPLASSLTPDDIAPYLAATQLPVHVVRDQFYDALQLCDAAIVASGTATLEVALLGVPMVIIYKTAASTYYIVKRIIKIPYIGLCNIVAGKAVIKELIQHEANPAAISAEIERILNDADYRQQMQRELAEVKHKLGKPGGAQCAAAALLRLLAQPAS